MAKRIYHVGISGGKDSTALLLWMIKESGIHHDQIIATFCDTQNEAACTYEHIEMLSHEVFPIRKLESEGFLNLALRKKRFPSTKARFCTTELKLKPTKHFLDSLQLQYANFEIIPVSGVRAGESGERRLLPEWGNPLDSYFGLREWRPLIKWQIEDVLTIHAKYSVLLNPLYSKGAKRVGCFPCIMSSKPELRLMAKNYPERVIQIREWERMFEGVNGISTFFPRNAVPIRFRTKTITTAKNEKMKVATIDDVVRWANSGWRAKGQAPDTEGLFEDQLKDLPPQICLAQHLACE